MASESSPQHNVGWLLKQTAERVPDQLGIAFPAGRGADGKREYEMVSFEELDRNSDALAVGLLDQGIPKGTRIAMLVPQSIEFITLVFALFKAGMVQVLIDPGMGRRNMIRCLSAVEPEGMIAIPAGHIVRNVLRSKFKKIRYAVTVGTKLGWGGTTYKELLATPC